MSFFFGVSVSKALQNTVGSVWHPIAPKTRMAFLTVEEPPSVGGSDCQKPCPAEGFGGKESVKGNRQGVLSRSITRRSGRIAKSCCKI